jgi:hypothetical protein
MEAIDAAKSLLEIGLPPCMQRLASISDSSLLAAATPWSPAAAATPPAAEGGVSASKSGNGRFRPPQLLCPFSPLALPTPLSAARDAGAGSDASPAAALHWAAAASPLGRALLVPPVAPGTTAIMGLPAAVEGLPRPLLPAQQRVCMLHRNIALNQAAIAELRGKLAASFDAYNLQMTSGLHAILAAHESPCHPAWDHATSPAPALAISRVWGGIKDSTSGPPPPPGSPAVGRGAKPWGVAQGAADAATAERQGRRRRWRQAERVRELQEQLGTIQQGVGLAVTLGPCVCEHAVVAAALAATAAEEQEHPQPLNANGWPAQVCQARGPPAAAELRGQGAQMDASLQHGQAVQAAATMQDKGTQAPAAGCKATVPGCHQQQLAVVAAPAEQALKQLPGPGAHFCTPGESISSKHNAIDNSSEVGAQEPSETAAGPAALGWGGAASAEGSRGQLPPLMELDTAWRLFCDNRTLAWEAFYLQALLQQERLLGESAAQAAGLQLASHCLWLQGQLTEAHVWLAAARYGVPQWQAAARGFGGRRRHGSRRSGRSRSAVFFGGAAGGVESRN